MIKSFFCCCFVIALITCCCFVPSIHPLSSHCSSFLPLTASHGEKQQYASEWLFFCFLFFLLFASLLSSKQEDRYHSFDCACSNKKETGRVCPPLISLANNGSQWEVLACLRLKSSVELSNNSKRSCVLVVTCLFTTLC